MWNEKEGEKLIERQIQRLTDVITWEQYCLWGDTLFRTQVNYFNILDNKHENLLMNIWMTWVCCLLIKECKNNWKW